MIEITYNAELCKRCGLCATACPLAIPVQRTKGTIPEIDNARLESCFRCGHCVAICPQGAISHSHFPEGTVTPVSTEQVPTYDQVIELVRSRRSKRRSSAIRTFWTSVSIRAYTAPRHGSMSNWGTTSATGAGVTIRQT